MSWKGSYDFHVLCKIWENECRYVRIGILNEERVCCCNKERQDRAWIKISFYFLLSMVFWMREKVDWGLSAWLTCILECYFILSKLRAYFILLYWIKEMNECSLRTFIFTYNEFWLECMFLLYYSMHDKWMDD